jgi:hypothetical protein
MATRPYEEPLYYIPAKTSAAGGTDDHAELSNLDYASALHTGFAASTHTHASYDFLIHQVFT